MTELRGLDSVEVAERVAAGRTNFAPLDSSRSLTRILRSNVLTLFNAVVGGSFILLLVLGYWRDALFGFFVIANIAIGVTQEYRAKRTLDRLALLNRPNARVLRDGEITEISRDDVVIDDALVLGPGDQLPADGVVIVANALEIDEALLTGESDPVSAVEGREVLSGSSVVAGDGIVRVTRVGADSYARRLTIEARRFALVNSEIRNELARVVRWISWALIPTTALVINGQVQAAGGWEIALTSGSWRQAALAAVASIVSMVPQGLVFITSVAFAVGAVTLSRQQVLVQELAAVEGLARVDIVCLDKTGTLTEGRIVLRDVEAIGETDTAASSRALGWFAHARNSSATTRALRSRFDDDDTADAVATIGFESSRQWSAVSFDRADIRGTWVLGAPEALLAVSDAPDLSTRISDLTASGLRILLLARADAVLRGPEPESPVLPHGLAIVAIVTLEEKVRSDAATTLDYFRAQGVGLRIISGDHPRTVAAVARAVGIDLTGDAFDARDLPTDTAELARVLETHDVFGRVTSTQKKDIVIALQSAGHVVAMTGDGVNDALALKQADIGIAMASGAAATRAVARLVLLDGQFSHLPSVVAEGRKVIANVERLSKLFLTKTVYAFMFALFFGSLLIEFPFLPRRLSVVDGLTIGLPALVLALLPNARRYRSGFLRRAVAYFVPSGLVTGTFAIAVATFARLSGSYSSEQVQAASVITLTLVALWVLIVLARPLDRLKFALLAAMYAGLAAVFMVPLTSSFFALTPPPAPLLLIAIGAAIPGCALVELVHAIRRRRLRAGAVRRDR